MKLKPFVLHSLVCVQKQIEAEGNAMKQMKRILENATIECQKATQIQTWFTVIYERNNI